MTTCACSLPLAQGQCAHCDRARGERPRCPRFAVFDLLCPRCYTACADDCPYCDELSRRFEEMK